MAPRTVGAALGLLAFSTTIIAGLCVHNPVSVTLMRATGALFVFCVIGLVMGAAARSVVREHMTQREEAMFGPDESDASSSDGADSLNTSTAGDAKPMGT